MEPENEQEIIDAVRGGPVLVTGRGTKPRASTPPPGFRPLSLRRWTGIMEYDPSEFVVTVKTGTKLRELRDELAGRGQFLPFDPPFEEGTIGGAVACGLNGPWRHRFGGIRDFILAVSLIDGDGVKRKAGGRVVKNVAGFDIPKFLVGSLGSYGVITEVTFKAFPGPGPLRLLEIPCADAPAAVALMRRASATRGEPASVDYDAQAKVVRLGVAGPVDALDALSRHVQHDYGGRLLEREESEAAHRSFREMAWADPDADLVCFRPPGDFDWTIMNQAPSGCRWMAQSSGQTLWVSGPVNWMREAGSPGLTLRGDHSPLHWTASNVDLSDRLKAVFDPRGVFPAYLR